ncbi:NADH-ubiquinone oxidoreductase subunit E family protein [Helicobacter canadensis]|nr:NADH-ubiquinone oxidoreductase subunit E family protein [Helicobacter canadensis]
MQKSVDIVKSENELLNSLCFNEVDCKIIVKRIC